MTQNNKKRLGRGLAALIGDDTTEEAVVKDSRSLRHLPIEFIKRNRKNPRRAFPEEALNDLAQSLRQKGMLQPIVVRPVADAINNYEIVAGERRWRAAQKAGLHEVPVIIRELSDAEALEIALVENVQRTDLNAIEEAEGYSRLLSEFGYSQQALAEAIGKSRSHIANTLRLLSLPETVREQIESGALTPGHARALVPTDNPEALAGQILSRGLSVRETETLVRRAQEQKLERDPGASSAKPAKSSKDADTRALERTLSEALGLSVTITHKGRQGGEVRIVYKTLDQFDDLCRRISRSPN